MTALNRPFLGAALLLSLLFAGTLTHYSLARHALFRTHLHDLGLISQSLWNATEGRGLVNSINPEHGRSAHYFGNHYTPILYLILPIYALWTDPRTLLVIQALVLAAGGPAAYLLGKRLIGSNSGGLLLAGLYLSHPALWFAGLYDYHNETLAASFLLWTLLFLETRRWRPFVLCAALAAACKEHVPLVLAFMAPFMALRDRSAPGKSLGLASLTFGGFLAAFLIINGAVIPAYAGDANHPYIHERYGHLGDSLPAVAGTLLRHPFETLTRLATPRHLVYYTFLLAPLGFLALLSPARLAPAVPVLLANGLSSIPITYDIGFYHAATIVPSLIWATAAALGRIRLGVRGARKPTPRRVRRLRFFTTFLLLNAAFWHVTARSLILPGLSLPLSPAARSQDWTPTQDHLDLPLISASIPAEDSLSVQFGLAAHFSHRKQLYQFPNRLADAEWALVFLKAPDVPLEDRKFWLEFSSLQVKIPRFLDAVDALLQQGTSHGLVLQEGPYLLFQRGAPHGPALDTARRLLETTRREWLSYEGRGYGRDRRAWDEDPHGEEP